MPKKKKIGSGIVVPKTVLEKAKTVHSTRARKLEEACKQLPGMHAHLVGGGAPPPGVWSQLSGGVRVGA